MDRKESIKTLLLGSASLPFISRFSPGNESAARKGSAVSVKSQWSRMPEMNWAGPSFWGNRLQDWEVTGGRLMCNVSGPNRTLHFLTHQLGENGFFSTQVEADLQRQTGEDRDYIGFRLGARGRFEDYRSAAVFGEGLDAGVTATGALFIGKDDLSDETVEVDQPLRLLVNYQEGTLTLTVFNRESDQQLSSVSSSVDASDLSGNIALVSHFPSVKEGKQPSVRFSDWQLAGEGVDSHPDQGYGPICFAQYTLHDHCVKLTAQLAPVERVEGHQVELQVDEGQGWKTRQTATVDPLSRTVHFRLEDWTSEESVPYRILLRLPLKDGEETFHYEGTIARNPVDDPKVKTAVFSCNADHGFPNNEIVEHVPKHEPDMAVFLGDQFYESHGGFGIQTDPLEKSSLDFLRKWYMFGWSYRDIFRHIPCAIIPDDHDVYHGNVWGAGGKDAPTDKGWGYVAQDQGGYKMPPEWVNMVQRAQTSHLPDAYDPTPVKQGIGVYYTDWNYGGISFAIIEDRKFKSAPQNVLPREAKVTNGFIQNRDFNIREYYDVDAELLGERQLSFLEHWSADWSNGVNMKAVLSQTNFCTVATLPEGSIIDQIVPRLEIPERGTYVEGDAPTTDMDSNGWPQKGRDKALQLIRKSFAFHIAGDQHLASVVQYGVDEHRDAGFAFAGPALNNVWPRRWWPQVDKDHRSLLGRPKNTGDFEDGFGNKMTVLAVANPVQTNREPEIIYDRSTGYGIVTFDKKERTIQIECWPRYVDPESNPGGQYDGWPLVVHQEDNYGRRAAAWLPEVRVEGMENPVVEVHNEESGELEYALRIAGSLFKPKVFSADGRYSLRVGDPDRDEWQTVENIRPGENQDQIVCAFTGSA
ncbi:alkaline phosphatase D family protein [Fodinibius sediminis]|uniref:PhoD-like phosphatase n=1 Tax=Fodinibius sediminis TaxID=1214077 RepID=A0A521C0L8_9BACT|nr:alkaline phosphatase D family protein [Fodinibius sediminis]SMO52924.1 PhoD-like phosphatase [Fodinibius sediminis]